MEQEIHVIFKIFSDSVLIKNKETILQELNLKLLNDITTLEILDVNTDHYFLKIKSCIRASWVLKLNHKTKELINNYVLQGLGFNLYQIHIIEIKEEAKIYNNL